MRAASAENAGVIIGCTGIAAKYCVGSGYVVGINCTAVGWWWWWFIGVCGEFWDCLEPIECGWFCIVGVWICNGCGVNEWCDFDDCDPNLILERYKLKKKH